MSKNNLLNFKVAGNKYTSILLVSFLIIGFGFQSSLSIQSFLFTEIENEYKELKSSRFKASEQTEFICLQDSIAEPLSLSSFKDYRNINFSTTSHCFYSMMLPHKLFNHSPPQFA